MPSVYTDSKISTIVDKSPTVHKSDVYTDSKISTIVDCEKFLSLPIMSILTVKFLLL